MSPEALGQQCDAHEDCLSMAYCGACHKPICRMCVQAFGYYCSTECSAHGAATVDHEVIVERRDSLQLSLRRVKRLIALVFALIMLFALKTGYKWFLDPAGKVAWTLAEAGSQYKMRILRHTDTEVTVLSGSKVMVVNAADGVVTRTFELTMGGDRPGADAFAGADDEDGDYYYGYGIVDQLTGRVRSRVHIRDDGYVLVGSSTIIGVDSAGQERFTTKLPHALVSNFQLSPGGGEAYCLVREPVDLEKWQVALKRGVEIKATMDAYWKKNSNAGNWGPAKHNASEEKALEDWRDVRKELQNQTTRLMCIDMATGAQRWDKPITAGISLSNLVAAEGKLVTMVTVQKPGEDMTIFLAARNAATGKTSWRTELPVAPGWGPEVHDGKILFDLHGELHGVTTSGDKAFSIVVPDFAGMADATIEGDMILFVGDQQAQAFSLGTGESMWEFAAPMAITEVTATDERVYFRGTITEVTQLNLEGALPPAYDELKDMDGFEGLTNGEIESTVHLLVAADRQSGKPMWTSKGVYGDLYADGDRVVVIADTAQTSMMSMMSGGSGETVIWQLKSGNGKPRYMKRHAQGLDHLVMTKKHMVGFVYQREDGGGGMLNPWGGGGGDGSTYDGLMGIRIK